MRKALFIGSFDPFTIGHADIAERALGLFDALVIAVGFNISKPERGQLATRRAEAIARFYADDPRVEVCAHSGLAVDLARERGACCIVKGVRDAADFAYETRMADVNRRLAPEIETVLLPARPDLADISSSMVRELLHHGVDVAKWIVC